MERVEPSVDSPAGAEERTSPPRRHLQTSPAAPHVDLEAALVRVKQADDGEGLAAALEAFGWLLQDEKVSEEAAGGASAVLIDRLVSVEMENRLKIFSLLRTLASRYDGSKEKLAEMGSLSVIASALVREAAESREAAGLLSDLLDVAPATQRMGRVQGCILMLATLLHGDDPLAAGAARKILDALSGQPQNVLLMAEAGHFKPMIQYLKRGSDMNKILMATAISRMELTEQKKAVLGESSIKPLTEMFASGKLEAKLSALAAIQKLCTSPVNVERLVDAGFAAPLLHLLHSVTSVLMTLREPAAAVLAIMSESRAILKSRSFVRRILSLLSTSNSAIQSHLLRALSNVAGQPGSLKAKKQMKENGAAEFLLSLLSEGAELRHLAIAILFKLSGDLDLSGELSGPRLNFLIDVVVAAGDPEERAAACGILSNIPAGDKKLTKALLRANMLPVLLSLIKETTFSPLLESAAGVLARFTAPSDTSLQRKAVELGAIPLLVKLLSEKNASSLARSRAAVCLAQLSQSSLALSRERDGARWPACVPSAEPPCLVHGGRCSSRATFCMEKAGAVPPLVELLRCGSEGGADEAAVEALSTLLPEGRCEGGSEVLERNSAVEALVGAVETGSPAARGKALRILELIFGNHGRTRERHGAAVQALLVDLAREGDPSLKPVVNRILAHLRVLPLQPSYL